ncbi:hypothetical protein L226DRAFT_617659 [Lentinus tigrinus ALCF2SS1-7]|uniref:Uncharacterized protein n=1 Tax=Lentinus tigrinus ALCF2SS1-6 TaxID=1328759 RepID=A0A5C2RN07_9APHY|nr:hypothetical protein L227DRAFT_658510 [Lentinus tigrinus ALCF2SS1-6]RPD68240.1 hypothetical protein L226DRAFT_617659 [Lentinus tigrinus ALCF2SS1-7]
MLSSDDAATLRSIGHNFIKLFVTVVFKTYLLAIYSILVVWTGSYLIPKRSRASYCLCAAVFVMFGLALALWMLDIHMVVSEVQMTFLSDSTDPLASLYSTAQSHNIRFAAVEDILYAYMTVIGDGVIIWRVYAFWSYGKERIVVLLPIVMLLGSTATSLMLTYCAVNSGSGIVLGSFQHPPFCRNIQTASYSMTLATTAIATILIAYKTWQHRRMYLDAFGKQSRRTWTQNVMFVLIETGILYMLFFLIQVILSLKSVNASIAKSSVGSFAVTMYQYSTSTIVGSYPTIIIVLVHSKHGVLRAEGESTFMNTSTLLFTRTTRRTEPRSSARPPETTVDLYEMAGAAKRDEPDLKLGPDSSSTVRTLR